MSKTLKYIKYTRNLSAALMLIDHSFYNEAATLIWSSIREVIFQSLFERKIEYNSTREAIKIFLNIYKDETSLTSDLLTVERVATLAEWDETFQLSRSEIDYLLQLHSSISNKIINDGSN